MVSLMQASPHADCPLRRPPYLHMQCAQHPMRPRLLTGGGCLKKGETQARIPAPGLPLLRERQYRLGMTPHVSRTRLPSFCISRLHLNCHHPPYTCSRASEPLPPPTRKLDIFCCAFLVCMCSSDKVHARKHLLKSRL